MTVIRTGTRYVAGTVSEGVSEAAEQWFENGGIIDGAGNITTRTEGMVNAAYNGMLAAQSVVILQPLLLVAHKELEQVRQGLENLLWVEVEILKQLLRLNDYYPK